MRNKLKVVQMHHNNVNSAFDIGSYLDIKQVVPLWFLIFMQLCIRKYIVVFVIFSPYSTILFINNRKKQKIYMLL